MNRPFRKPGTGLAAVTSPALPRRWYADHEFLPSALEVLETPPSPVLMALILFVCGFVCVGLAWGYFGRIDIVASAQGKLQPVGRVKIVQPLENGRINRVLASDGDHVTQGDVLIDLDGADIQAEVTSASLAFTSAKAEVLRRLAADAAITNGKMAVAPTIAWTNDVPAAFRNREKLVVAASFSQLNATQAVLDAQRTQKMAERDQIAISVRVRQQLIATLQDRVDTRASLFKTAAGTRAAVTDAMEALQNQQAQLAVQNEQLVSAERGTAVLATQQDKTREDFRLENAQKLKEAQRQEEDATQSIIRARTRLEHLTLRAPVTGIVQASLAASPGQMLTAGEEVLRVVPDLPTLEVEVYVQNRDIGFIKVGQDVVVKVEAFPFTRYGTLIAHVTHVAGDAIPEPDAERLEGRSGAQSNSGIFSGSQRFQNLVFPVRMRLDATWMTIDGNRVPLSSGMAVTADFKLGRRRLIEYFLAPLLEVGSRALTER